jgi:ribonucleotide reductase alpha subunit
VSDTALNQRNNDMDVDVQEEDSSIIDIRPSDRFKLSPTFLATYANKKPNWGPVGELTYRRTYARVEDEGLWWRTCKRVVEGVYTYQKWHCRKLNLPWSDSKGQRSAQKMYELMFDFKFLPPGRGLWMCGTSYVEKYGGAALNNCAFVSTYHINVDFADPFCFMMDMSMLGVGVGANTAGVGRVIIKKPKQGDDVHVVSDDRQGWVALGRRILNAYVGEATLPRIVDYSKVRKAGSLIKGFGGIAAGPEPLMRLVEMIHEILSPLIGQPITSTAITDLFNVVGVCVVSGNVRRSAELILGAANDKAFADLKNPAHQRELLGWRWASNNSILAEIGMDYTDSAESAARNGEPGFLWLDTCRKYGRLIDPPDNADLAAEGTNPCLTGDVRVPTSLGYLTVRELFDKHVNFDIAADGCVIGGQPGTVMTPVAAPFFFTKANAAVYRLVTAEGLELRLTADHKLWADNGDGWDWVAASDLEPGAILLHQKGSSTSNGTAVPYAELIGYNTGDGWFNKAVGWVVNKEEQDVRQWLDNELQSLGLDPTYDRPTEGQQSTTNKKVIEIFEKAGAKRGPAHEKEIPTAIWSADRDSRTAYLRGLFTADGHVEHDQEHRNCSVRLGSTSRKLLLQVQLLLLDLGIMSRVYSGAEEGYKLLPDQKGGYQEYLCKQSWRLVIGGEGLAHYAEVVGFRSNAKTKKLTAWLNRKLKRGKGYYTRPAYLEFVSLEFDGYEDVYDVTVPKYHSFIANGIVVHNCSEQTLENHELCCLVETFPSRHETYEEYQLTLKWAYLYAKTITLLPTHNARTNAAVMRNRRIGCSQSGITESFAKHGRRTHFEWCDVGYKYLRNLDRIYSDWLCIPRSKKITSVKPSGTVSLLPGVTPGIHYPHSEYYYRTIRVAKNNPLLIALENAKYRIEEDVYDKSSMVVYFPIHEENFERAKHQVSMWEQIANAVAMQRYWADNQVSITVNFSQEEASQIKYALQMNEDQLKSISFLPIDDKIYQQAPYQTITKDEYERAIANLKPIDYTNVVRDREDRYCDGDKCNITLPS